MSTSGRLKGETKANKDSATQAAQNCLHHLFLPLHISQAKIQDTQNLAVMMNERVAESPYPLSNIPPSLVEGSDKLQTLTDI